jgi:hypothetical protein
MHARCDQSSRAYFLGYSLSTRRTPSPAALPIQTSMCAMLAAFLDQHGRPTSGNPRISEADERTRRLDFGKSSAPAAASALGVGTQQLLDGPPDGEVAQIRVVLADADKEDGYVGGVDEADQGANHVSDSVAL